MAYNVQTDLQQIYVHILFWIWVLPYSIDHWERKNTQVKGETSRMQEHQSLRRWAMTSTVFNQRLRGSHGPRPRSPNASTWVNPMIKVFILFSPWKNEYWWTGIELMGGWKRKECRSRTHAEYSLTVKSRFSNLSHPIGSYMTSFVHGSLPQLLMFPAGSDKRAHKQYPANIHRQVAAVVSVHVSSISEIFREIYTLQFVYIVQWIHSTKHS